MYTRYIDTENAGVQLANDLLGRGKPVEYESLEFSTSFLRKLRYYLSGTIESYESLFNPLEIELVKAFEDYMNDLPPKNYNFNAQILLLDKWLVDEVLGASHIPGNIQSITKLLNTRF